MNNTIDATRPSLMLNDLRLPVIKEIWPKFAERSDKEGWPAARFLAAIAEHEISERARYRITNRSMCRTLRPRRSAARPGLSSPSITAWIVFSRSRSRMCRLIPGLRMARLPSH